MFAGLGARTLCRQHLRLGVNRPIFEALSNEDRGVAQAHPPRTL